MKIAIVSFPINDVGGINSWAENFIAGSRTLGHTVDFLHAQPGKTECDPKYKIHKRRMSILPGSSVRYGTNEEAALLVEKLNKYDFVLFLHGSPHPTKQFLSLKGHMNWKKLYDCLPPKVVIFHDANWNKTNSWLSDVADKIDLLIAGQPFFIPSSQIFPGRSKKDWSFQPLIVPQTIRPFLTRADRVIVATQWLGWKRHKLFVPHLDKITRRVRLYGGGIEYHNLKKNDWPSTLVDHTVAQDPQDPCDHQRHSYFGFVPYEEVLEEFGTSQFALDLSDKGYVNMTHLEPLCLGANSIMSQRIFEKNDPKIPRELFVLFRSHEDLIQLISRYKYDQNKADRAHAFAMEHFDHVLVTKNILQKVTSL